MTDSIDVWSVLADSSWKHTPEQSWFHDYILYPGITARLLPSASVLDFGCGSGELIRLLNARGHSTVGFDPSSAMALRARTANSGVLVVSEQDAIRPRWFDAVVLNMVLSCVSDPRRVLADTARFGSRIVVTIPHPCFSIFSDLHTTTRRTWDTEVTTDDERTLYVRELRQTVRWNANGATTHVWHRTLSTWWRIFLSLELEVADMVELVPVDAGACMSELFGRFTAIPGFVLFDLRREDGLARSL